MTYHYSISHMGMSTCQIFGQPSFYGVAHIFVVLYIVLVRLWQRMASKALLMSNVTRSVLCGSFLELMPLRTLCLRFVKNVFVECNDLKPSCLGAKEMCGLTSMISHSVTLEGCREE